MKKKLFVLMFQLTLTIALVAQEGSGYVVLANNDTVKFTDGYFNYQINKLTCTINKVEKEFKAKDVLAYKMNEEEGESARFRAMVIGTKRWFFLERTIKGKVSLFEKEGVMTSTSNAQNTKTMRTVKVYWYRKVGEPKGEVHKLITRGQLKKFLSDCPAYVTKQNSKDAFKGAEVEWVDQIKYYNSNCK